MLRVATRGAGRGRGRGGVSGTGTTPSLRPQSGTPTPPSLPITPAFTAAAPPTGRKASLIDDDDGPKFGFASTKGGVVNGVRAKVPRLSKSVLSLRVSVWRQNLRRCRSPRSQLLRHLVKGRIR
jgi:hypothetical protein